MAAWAVVVLDRVVHSFAYAAAEEVVVHHNHIAVVVVVEAVVCHNHPLVVVVVAWLPVEEALDCFECVVAIDSLEIATCSCGRLVQYVVAKRMPNANNYKYVVAIPMPNLLQ